MASHAGTCWILRVIVATIIAMVGMVMIVSTKVGMMIVMAVIVMMTSHAGTWMKMVVNENVLLDPNSEALWVGGLYEDSALVQ